MIKRKGRLLRAGSVPSKFAAVWVMFVALLPLSVSGQGSCFRPPTGLTGWWPLDGNPDPLVSLGAGTLIGDPVFAPGEVGQGLFLDGVDDALQIHPAPKAGTLGFTAECWISPGDVDSHHRILSWISPDGQPSVILGLGDSQNPQAGSLWTSFRNASGITGSFATPGGLVVTGAWQHVALVYTRIPSNAAIYLNGTFVGSGFVPLPHFQTAQTHGLHVGVHSNAAPGIAFTGGIDEITFYDRPLNSNQVLSIFLAGAAGKCKDMIAPVIVAQPLNQTVALGGTATFSVTVQGTAPFIFRWRRNGLTIPGAPNEPTLVITNVGQTNVGTYSVQITNAFGLATSSNAFLGLATNSVPPSIVNFGPSNLTVQAGGNAQFTVTATGSPPLSYQWEFNGQPVPGGTNSSLLLVGVTPAQSGFYRCIVSNPLGSTTSPTATLTVITVPPVEQLVSLNSVWKYNDTGADLGTAWRAPAYDDTAWPSGPGLLGVETSIPFPYPVPILTPLALGSGTNGPGTNNLLTYYFRTTFTFNGDPSAVSLVSTSFVDDGAVFFLNGTEVGRLRVPFGQTFSTPALAGPIVEGTPEVATFATTNLINGLNTLAVEVHQTSVASSDVVFGMNLIAATNGPPPPPSAPVIVSQPQNRTVTLGSTTSFSVIATGAPPLSYRWHFNGTPLPVGTNSVLTLVNVGTNSAGNYFAVVSNPFGSATSSVATLTVIPPTNSAPRIVSPTVVVTSNILVGGAASFRVVASGSTPLFFQWYRNGTPISGANSDTLFLSNIQLAQAGTFFAIVTNPFGAATNRGFILNVSDGQPGGLINFSLLGSSNAFVFESATNPVPVGPAYLAQLYAGLTADDLRPIGAAVPFNTPGRFSGGTRTIPFVTAEIPIPVQVRVWESAKGPTFEESLANRGRIGQSAIVQITPRFVPNPPALLSGLTSFTLSFAPVVTGQSLTVNQGSSLPIVLIATDPDGDALSFSVTPPSHGSLSGTPPNLTYTPAECYVGPDSFTFTASDGTFAASATVSILVTPSQAPPIASFTVSPLAVLSGDQTNQLIISPNNSNAVVVLDASLSLALNCGPLVFQWFAVEFPITPFATGPIVTNEFFLGDHSVLLAVSRSTNLTGTATSDFEVITAAEAVQLILDQVQTSALPLNVKRPLLATLSASAANFEAGDFQTANNQLHAFCNKVRSQIEPDDPVLAQTIIAACRSIESVFDH